MTRVSSPIIDQLLNDFHYPEDETTRRGDKFMSLSKSKADKDPGHPDLGIVAAEQDWQQNKGRPFTVEDSLMNDILKSASGKSEDIGKTACSNEQMHARIADLLHMGKTPASISAHLDKVAEMEVFDRNSSDEFLKGQSGLMGLTYIEPNHFNQTSCVASMRHINNHGGKVVAASVKRIAACNGCSECKKNPDGTCKCGTYNLPIVSNTPEAQQVVAALTHGTGKKAALVARHNKEFYSNETQQVDRLMERPTTVIAGSGSLSKFDAPAVKEAASTFTPKMVQASINEGKTLQEVYVAGKKAHGSAVTERVVRTYLDTLKKTGSRVNLASLDCKLLKGRLTASETILGKPACKTCTLRNDMHCAYTGGTLLTYPGMEASGSKRASAESAQDGVQIMEALGLEAPVLDIQPNADPDYLQVDLSNTQGMEF